MICISIEVPEAERYRFEPLLGLRARFVDDGFDIGFCQPAPDLRVIELEAAILELQQRPDGRFPTPTIIDEENDGAEVGSAAGVRTMMAHPDVKVWLKRNTFRDASLNNQALATGQYHTEVLNEVPHFRIPVPERTPPIPVSADMAGKIRLLPTAGLDLFAPLRRTVPAWNDRSVDLVFAGFVDYPPTFHHDDVTRLLAGRHRRAAVEEVSRLRDLSIVLGVNRSLDVDLYRDILLRSSISVSPWGLGEYAYRDYESILAGCVMVKPLTDHVRTFAPDIYQSGTYYRACRPDFADLSVVVEDILADRDGAAALAVRAREDLLEANGPDPVHAHFLEIFNTALTG